MRNPERKACLVAPPRLKESYDTWTVSCGLRTVDGNPVKACATSQEQIEQRSRQRVLATELQPAATGAVGTQLLPFGLALEQGIALQIPALRPNQSLRRE
jgi:invasion protein IalB